MVQWVVVEREGLADDARAFRTLIAEMRSAQERAPNGEQRASAFEEHVLAFLAPSMAGRTARLATQLLAYAGGQALAPVQLCLIPFLCNLAYALRRVLDARIDVSVDVGDNCPPCFADRHFLEDALLNLIVNARDAMPEGGRLGLGARAFDLPDARAGVEISVSDSGAGMSAEALKRAGQPFFTTKTDHPLGGMGLAATNGFAHASGGVLALHSPPSGGLTAALRLPRPPASILLAT